MVLPRAHPSGMITCTFDHQEKPTDFSVRQVFQLGPESGRILEAAGLGFENILEYTSYHENMHDHLGTFIKVRDESVSEPWPAWTAIGITELAIPALEWR